MILILSILIGAVLSASPQRPINLHECSTVKFDLSDLDNALRMYKTCSTLGSTLNEEERGIYMESLRDKMDTACLSLILACGVNVNEWNREKRSTRVNNIRKQKLYRIMNYLTDIPAGGNVSFKSPETDMDSRVRWGLIHTIQERIDKVHERLSHRCSAMKRSPEESMDGEPKAQCDKPTTTTCATHKSTVSGNNENSTSPASSGRFSAEFVVGNIGFLVIVVFALSAICCFVSLLLCKVCCLTDCSIAAIHWWSKGKQQRQENSKKGKKKNKKKRQIKECPSTE